MSSIPVLDPSEDGDRRTALFVRNAGVASLQLSQIITNWYLTDFDVWEDDGTPLKSFGWREHLKEYEGCRS